MNPSPSANSMPTTTDPEQANTPPPSSSSSPGAHPPFTFPTLTQPRYPFRASRGGNSPSRVFRGPRLRLRGATLPRGVRPNTPPSSASPSSSPLDQDIPSTPSTPVSSPKPTPPHTPPIQRHSPTELQHLPPSIRREVGIQREFTCVSIDSSRDKMNSILFSCHSGGTLIVTSDPPLKRLTSREFLGEFNASVNFTCVSKGYGHDWSGPEDSLKTISFYSSSDIFSFIKRLQNFYNQTTTSEDVNDINLSTLSISKLKNIHVGFYDCQLQSFSTPSKKNSLYLYVNDNRRPFALNSPLTYVSAEEGSDAYIPCRPSHKDILVRIERRDNPGVQVHGLSFNRRKGFLLQNVSIEEEDGAYRCFFSSSRVRDEVRDVQLSVYPRTEMSEIPLDSSSNPLQLYLLLWTTCLSLELGLILFQKL
ncbi:unnamed protein product [Lepeophtheirus salmonis]|uniref:(salmon louse) hypothetical protein n=1 Tax=Lepeophtheirus salmonis TaxID=72036 RepID=A0A7R8H9Z8_LEPSM|nr:unnamed protein product [Lepeophtheirus salmonis]CAF2968840.1 unnamed protein product [Lepeophtheirus salmonis]